MRSGIFHRILLLVLLVSCTLNLSTPSRYASGLSTLNVQVVNIEVEKK